MPPLEIYRHTTIGNNLSATLDEMVYSGKLAPELAVQVQLQFDKSMSAALEYLVTSRASFKGNLHTYRYCDNVWTFMLRDVMFKNEEMSGKIGKLKIVACDSAVAKDEVPPQQ
uniref:Uncharacterized protein n=1 Tax=Avena sativa TaxID=4498 RepID=A0ACD5V433_AVESA